MVHTKPTLPAGHGELLARPATAEWPALARANHAAAPSWSFAVAGTSAADLRALARREALADASAFSARLGVEVREPGAPDELIVATGHQPELYHPGVWIKDFLLERLAVATGASAFDVVVDSDGFELVSVSSPCLTPEMHRCTQYLAIGEEHACFATAPVPSAHDLADWERAVREQLETLPAPAIRRHFAEYSAALEGSREDAANLGEFLTFTRRRFEAAAGTGYLELPATRMCKSEAFATFVVDLIIERERFAEAYNGALADYRSVNKTRSAAQPFPDLERRDGRFELPLWVIGTHERTTLWCESVADGFALSDETGAQLATLPAEPQAAVAALRTSGIALGPKALALTLFVRGFACDFFIHGVGGGRYDQVTDDVFRRYYGVEPPAFAVASITMYLPLGMHVVTEDEVSAARERLNRLEHNPDAMLSDVDFDSAEERSQAGALAAEKSELVSAIAAPDADKKALGLRIREVNAALGALLAPLRESLAAEVTALESQRAASEILTDRTYPLCFWSPLEVADKAQ